MKLRERERERESKKKEEIEKPEEGEAIKWVLRKSGAAFALKWIGF